MRPANWKLFNDIKKRKAGAAIAEDPEWSYYSEIYDVIELDQEFNREASSLHSGSS